jgi:hypothetical protein
VSYETGFVSILPKQEPKEISKLSETKGFVSVLSEFTETGLFRFFGLFWFNQKRTEIARRQRDKVATLVL